MQEVKIGRIMPVGDGPKADMIYIVGLQQDRVQITLTKKQIMFLLHHRSQFAPENVTEHKQAIEIDFERHTTGTAVYAWVDSEVFQIRNEFVCMTGKFQHYERIWECITNESRYFNEGCKTC